MRRIALVKLDESPVLTPLPVSPSFMVSSKPPDSKNRTGVPSAAASSGIIPKGSPKEG